VGITLKSGEWSKCVEKSEHGNVDGEDVPGSKTEDGK